MDEKFMEDNVMNDMTLQDFLSLMPPNWFEEDGQVKAKEEDFDATIQGIRDFFKTKAGKALRGDWRAKMQSFTVKNGYVPEGMTNVDVMGTYVVGTRPASPEDTLKRAKRTLGEQIYSRALTQATNSVLKEVGFKHKPNEDYSDRAQALLALEADSLSSKGPYDNGEADTAIKTVDGVLSNSYEYRPLPDDLLPAWGRGLVRRQSEYKQIVDRTLVYEPQNYCAYMQSRGLARTMRGFPFYASGNSTLRLQHYHATVLMFRRVAGFKFTDAAASEYIGKVTVDEFIQAVLVHLYQDLHLMMSQWYNLYHSIIIPISRDQGSPFKSEWSGGDLTWTGERKDRKYRLVTPISGFVQAALIMATKDLVAAAPKTTGRIGLQDPATNKERMNGFIHAAEEAERVLISTDFSSYDSTLPGYLMGSMCAMYSTLYDDPAVQDCLRMAGVVATQKIMVLPTSVSEKGKPYSLFRQVVLPEIKGDRNFAVRSIASQLKGSNLKSKLKRESATGFDYMARAFYICRGYLPSGLILTNTLGSDCTLLLTRDLVPSYLENQGIFPSQEDPYNAISSGDDACQEVPKPVYDRIGYTGVLVALEEAFKACNMIVNAKKQLKILLKGLPLIDFLQQVYTQYDSPEIQEAYRKFCRQAPSLPYKERYSALYQVLQWVIVWGKLDSALCEENLDFAARVMAEAGRIMKSEADKKGYRPPVPPNWYGSRNTLFYDPEKAINKSTLCGMEQFVGLVKNYGQTTLAELVRYDLDPTKVRQLADDFDSELETRAPHRAQLATQIFNALGADFKEALGDDERIKDDGNYVSLIPRFTAKLEEFSGVSINPQKLDQPKVGGGVQHDGVDAADLESQDDADDYE